jgi:hypothetical protein
LPFWPLLVEAETLAAAFRHALGECPDSQWCRDIPHRGEPDVFWEVTRDQPPLGMAAREQYTRRDTLVSRRRWQYQPRQEARGVLAGAPAGEG